MEMEKKVTKKTKAAINYNEAPLWVCRIVDKWVM